MSNFNNILLTLENLTNQAEYTNNYLVIKPTYDLLLNWVFKASTFVVQLPQQFKDSMLLLNQNPFICAPLIITPTIIFLKIYTKKILPPFVITQRKISDADIDNTLKTHIIVVFFGSLKRPDNLKYYLFVRGKSKDFEEISINTLQMIIPNLTRKSTQF